MPKQALSILILLILPMTPQYSDAVTNDPGDKSVWARIGWNVGWATACNLNYSGTRDIHKRMQELEENRKLPGTAYQKYSQQRGRFVGRYTPVDCKKGRVDKVVDDVNRYLDRFTNAANTSISENSSAISYSNNAGSFVLNPNRNRLTLTYQSDYVDTLVKSIKNDKKIQVAVIFSKDWYRPDKFEFTFIEAEDVYVEKEGSPDIITFISSSVVQRILESREENLNVYLAAMDSNGAWAWARFRP